MDLETKRRRIRETIAQVPRGTVASYGQIGELAGARNSAREVARVLKYHAAGRNLPWHRIVRASGQIAFPAGSDTFLDQCARLENEGVAVSNGRIDMRRYRWKPDIDELLWKPPWDAE